MCVCHGGGANESTPNTSQEHRQASEWLISTSFMLATLVFVMRGFMKAAHEGGSNADEDERAEARRVNLCLWVEMRYA